MTLLGRQLRRRQLLRAGVAATGALILPGKAPAQGGAKPLSGTTLNIGCWNSPYAKLLTGYVPQFEEATGAKVNYETPSFPIYNHRIDIELSTTPGRLRSPSRKAGVQSLHEYPRSVG
jgi:multiple sugar transport system substrate-binding protein